MFKEIDSMTAAMLLALILVLAGMFITALVQGINRFRRDLQYINMEISRTIGSEKAYWMEQRRRLWRSLLPFCRR